MTRKSIILALTLILSGCACRQQSTRVKVDVRCWYGTAHVEVEHDTRSADQGTD